MQDTALIRKSILIVENDELNTEVMAKFLQASHDCFAVATASHAVEILEKKHFDLILLDINLGDGVGGLGLVQKLQENGKINKVKVLAVTAFGAMYQKSEILNAGCHGFLAKPFGKTDLLRTIRELLQIPSDENS